MYNKNNTALQNKLQNMVITHVYCDVTNMVDYILSTVYNNSGIVPPFTYENNAASIILAHNHPSGDTKPSREDIDMTEKIKQAGKVLNIKVLDHIIIGDGKHTSFAEMDLL